MTDELEDEIEQEDDPDAHLLAEMAPRGRGRPPADQPAVTKQMEEYILHAWIRGTKLRTIARNCRIHPITLNRVLEKLELKRQLTVSKHKVASALPKAADNVVSAIESGNVDVSLRVLDRSGSLKLEAEQQEDNQVAGGITINVGVLDPRAAGSLLAQLAGRVKQPLLDDARNEDSRRAGQGTTIQAIPAEVILSRPAPSMGSRADSDDREESHDDGNLVDGR